MATGSSVNFHLWRCLSNPHLPHLKPILVGSCYRPPSANSQYLDNVCEMLDNVCDINRELYFLGDLNIDWLSSSCPLKKNLQTVTSTCNLVQVVSQPTRVFTNSTGMTSSTCIDHIFTNAAEISLKAVSVKLLNPCGLMRNWNIVWLRGMKQKANKSVSTTHC